MAFADALAGRTLGEFQIVEKIGEGGFSDVFRAVQPLLAREAVIYTLPLYEMTRMQSASSPRRNLARSGTDQDDWSIAVEPVIQVTLFTGKLKRVRGFPVEIFRV